MSNIKPVDKLKNILAAPSVQEQFKNALQDNAQLFQASILDLYGQDTYLQKCDPGLVVKECLKAAVLKLPISRSLGFAWIIPYKNVPQFQVGYRGLIQLAIRSGQYKAINADAVRQGEIVEHDRLTGTLTITGTPDAPDAPAIGYFAYIALVNGFEKAIYWTTEQVKAHAQAKSPSWSNRTSPWHTDFDAMAKKTLIRSLLGKYGIMSIEMQTAMIHDHDNDVEAIRAEIADHANTGDMIDASEVFSDKEEKPAKTKRKKKAAKKEDAPQEKEKPPAEKPASEPPPIEDDGPGF